MCTPWQQTVRHLAEQERQRNGRAKPYGTIAYLDCPTSKQEGSPIIGTDTIKGCGNDCFRCYANRIGRYHRKVFTKPVKCVVAGFPVPELVYRFGTFGDPATDWSWTFREIERLKEIGMRRFYVLTKLQSIDGFRDDPSLCLHVSFDPLDMDQLRTTMRNVDQVVARKVVRIKSIRSGIRALMNRQRRIIEFAQQRGLPILETRFYTHVKADLELLQMCGYKRKGTLYKYPASVLEDCFDLQDHLVCDQSNTGKCRDCLNCLSFLS